MSVVRISRDHTQGIESARSHADQIVDQLSEKFGINYRWDGDTVNFKGAGAKGFMSISSTHVELKIELSFMLRPFKSRIEQEVNQNLDDFCA